MKERTDIENIISESFEQFSVIPSEAVKQRINRSMFFLNLIHFHVVKLIIGTSLFTVVTGVVIYFSLLNNSSDDLQNSNIQNPKIIEKTNESIANETNTENEFSTEQNSNKFENPQKIASYLAMTKTDTTKLTENEKSASFNSSNNKKDNSSNRNSFENQQKIASYNAISKNNKSKNIEQNLITKSENIADNNEINHNSDIESTEIVSNSLELNKNENACIDVNNEISNKLSNSATELNSDIIYNKMKSLSFDNFVSVSETYNMNLLAIDSALLKQYLKTQNRWFLDLYWMPSLTTTFYKTKDSEFKNFAEQKNNAVQNSLSYNSFGISGGFFKNNMLFKAGVGSTNLSDKYYYKLILNNPTEKLNITFNNNPYDFEQNGTYYNIDTVGGYYHYTFMQDSVIHLFDSIYVDITDSNIVNKWDSVRYIQYDSLKNKSYLNNYRYFEIPLSIGYRFQYNNFEIIPEIGIITGFLYKKDGMNISNDLKNNETYIRTFPYKQIVISGTVAININYNISENLGIFIEPAYRQSIASVYKSASIIQGNSKSFALKFGIRKKF